MSKTLRFVRLNSDSVRADVKIVNNLIHEIHRREIKFTYLVFGFYYEI